MIADEKGHSDDPPSAKSVIDGGYNQTYIIMNNNNENENDGDAKGASPKVEGHEVFFRCGNWCYSGHIQLGHLKLGTADLPVIIPTLQRQQGSLRYYCHSSSVPKSSKFSSPIEFMNDALQFVAAEMISDEVDAELRKMSGVFSWIDDDSASTYFELALSDLPECMNNVGIAASKTYSRDLIIISIYFEKSIYFVIKPGEGNQPLLDVRFPDVSKHGQGLLITAYNDHCVSWRKLTLWHVLSLESAVPIRELPKIKTINASSKNYMQTYFVMKSNAEAATGAGANASVYHDALFRFGSWCYSGRVQLTPALSLADIPFVIPALRMQQSRLDFLCDVNSIPTNSPFAAAIAFVHRLSPILENQIVESEDVLRGLVDRLTRMGLGDSVSRWLEGDPKDSFFEFKIQPDSEYLEAFKGIELGASKCYHASGIVTITIIFQGTIYVSLAEGVGDCPLLDSRFVDVSGKGRGYQISCFSDGVDEWRSLRKVSIWQTVGALEQEFRDRASQYSQAKEVEEKQREERRREEEEEAATNAAAHALREGSKNVEEGLASISLTAKSEEPIQEAQEKSSSPASGESNEADSKDSKASAALSRPAVSRPHHLPKMALDSNLSKRMDEIRRNMATQEDGGAAWDETGRPKDKIRFK